MNRTAILTLGFLLSMLFTSTSTVGTSYQDESDTYRQLDLFGAAFERARRDYVDNISDEQLIENAINGMLSALDPHSGYLNARLYKEMQVQTKGEFGGLGIEVTLDNGWVRVISPIDETPASQAGIQPGDYITHLDGKSVLGMSLNEAVDKMRGPPNSDIRLTIRREGIDPFDLTLTRAIIKIQSVKSRIEGNDIGYLRITSFTDRTGISVQQAVRAIKEQAQEKIKGYVLDLRNNPGGLLDQAIIVADIFLDHGEIVSTRARRTEDIQRFQARKGDMADGLPIVVLINDGSASAAEIVAGALQDHKRAIVVGTRSFGKGSVQTIIPLQGRGAMRLTTARYYTPSGRSIQAVGIDPDITIEQARVHILNTGGRPRSEADLQHALQNDTLRIGQGKENFPTHPFKGGLDKRSNIDKIKKEKDGDIRLGSFEDYQLAWAFNLLRGLSIYHTTHVGEQLY